MITGQPISFCSPIVLRRAQRSDKKSREREQLVLQNDQFVLKVRLGTDEVSYPMKTLILAEDRLGRLGRIDRKRHAMSGDQ